VKGLRSAEPSDLLEIASLGRRIFRQREHKSDESLASYYRKIFFENPWRDERYSSVVYVGENGRIAGFIGVIPRPMMFAGRSIIGVATTEFMVSPEARGVIGPLLLRRVLRGSQDFTIGDRGTDSAIALYEAFGGIAVVWNSLYWSVPLDRVALRFETSTHAPTSPLRDRLLRRAARAVDSLASRLTSQPRLPAGVSEEPLDLQAVVDSLPRFVAAGDLYPQYDQRSLSWLLDRIRGRDDCERLLTRKLVRDGRMIGWYIYQIRAGGVADIIQAAALSGDEVAVFDSILCGIAQEGCTVVNGRLDRRFASVIVGRRLPLTLAQPWVGIHSRSPEITAAFATGRAFLSRLDGEWWLGF
jgi:hypothetical protein